MNMSKNEKSAYFRHVFANNFFLVNFFTTFSTDSKKAWNSAFFHTHIELLNTNIFLLLLALFFCKLWLQIRRKQLKKTEKFFINVP